MRTMKLYRWMGMVAVVAYAFLLAGCAMWDRMNAPPPNPLLQQQQQQQPQQQQYSQSPPYTPPPSQGPSQQTSQGSANGLPPQPQYFDFPDIPIPAELTLVSKDSYVFQSGTLKAGLLTLKGRVDVNSLINFFQAAMPRQGWKPKGAFRYRRSVLFYEKHDKACIINVNEDLYNTYVEIYVAPVGG